MTLESGPPSDCRLPVARKRAPLPALRSMLSGVDSQSSILSGADSQTSSVGAKPAGLV